MNRSDPLIIPTDMHNASTGAAQLFWQALHPNANTEASLPTDWDMFHRLGLVVHNAIESSPCALEMFDVARVLASLFGAGGGRVICRATAGACSDWPG